MKILAIRIKNLASLEGVFEIDFTQEPLKTAGIFAITGPTGAGKSTILDALCLALYSRTPRYSIAKEQGNEVKDVSGGSLQQGDVRNILRDGVADGFAEVDFVGIDNQEYRASWSVKRAYNRADGKLQGEQVELKNLTTNVPFGGKKTEVQDEIARVVGFSFEQFTRSVLLAQGDFTSFMRASNRDKANLLERLTGTFIYSKISEQIHYRNSEEEKKLKEIKSKIQGINLLTEEELDNLTQNQTRLNEQLIDLNHKTDQVKEGIQWHQKCKEAQNQLTIANDQFISAKNDWEQASYRIQQLNQVEQVQVIAKNFHDWKSAEKELLQKNSELEKTDSILSQLNDDQERILKNLKRGEEDYDIKKKNKVEALPEIEEAKKLDIQLVERLKVFKVAEEEVRKLKSELQELEKTYQNEKEEELRLSTSLEEIKKWIEERRNRKAVAENKELLISKLKDAEKRLNEISALETKISTDQHNQFEISKSEEALKASVEAKNIENQQFKKEFDAVNQELSALSDSNIEEIYRFSSEKIIQLIEAKSKWHEVFTQKKELSELLNKMESLCSELNLNVDQLKISEENYFKAKIEKETSERILNQSRLAVSENIESLRKNLSEGDECPVCGSLEHPYAKHNPIDNILLTDLEQQHLKLEKQYESSLMDKNNLQAKIDTLTQSVQAIERSVSDKEKLLESLQHQWNNLSIASEAGNLEDSEIENWIDSKLNELKESQTTMGRQLDSLKALRSKKEDYTAKIDKLSAELGSLNNSILDKQRDFSSLKEKMEAALVQKNNSESDLQLIKEELHKIFPDHKWFDSWKADSSTFTNRLLQFCEEWKTKNEQLTEAESKRQQTLDKLLGLELRLEKDKQHYSEKDLNFQELQKEIELIQQHRKNIFDGLAVEKILENLDLEIQKSFDQLEEIKKQVQQNSESIAQKIILKNHIEQEILQRKSIAEANNTIVLNWLTDFNSSKGEALDMNSLEQLMALSQEWILEERKAIRTLENNLKQKQTLLELNQNNLDKILDLKISEHTLEELNQQLLELSDGIKKIQENCQEIQVKLRMNEENLTAIGTFKKVLEDQETLASGWAKLNDIIGSADGAKFRNLAQEYTLDVLLQYANIHLKVLAKRYSIERIPNTLGIQVIDEDMGNDIRSVYSLSGGESFLVSLALALGLSSLSSNRLRVESLFIDEGFGSLDPSTLNIAMDVLERLHNQGRKVGVISHVQEMTERIPVQIKVSKMSSGKSKIAILGH